MLLEQKNRDTDVDREVVSVRESAFQKRGTANRWQKNRDTDVDREVVRRRGPNAKTNVGLENVHFFAQYIPSA